MALDGRYQWVTTEDKGVLDAIDRHRTIGVGIENGRVILTLGMDGGWVSLPPGIATEVGMNLRSADMTLEQQLKQRQRES